MENAAAATNVRMHAEFTAANVESQRVLVEEHGVQTRPFPAEVSREMLRHSDDVVRATAQEDDLARRIFESWDRFRADAGARNPYAEQGYLQFLGVTWNRCVGGSARNSCDGSSGSGWSAGRQFHPHKTLVR